MPNFISFAASIAELAHGEKSHTQSLTHSPSLFDAPATEALVLPNIHLTYNVIIIIRCKTLRNCDFSAKQLHFLC